MSIGELGVFKVDEIGGALVPFAFQGTTVYGLDRDDAGNLYAHGFFVEIGVQRSTDNGATWTKLNIASRNSGTEFAVDYNGGSLAVVGYDGMVRMSRDAGNTFSEAALPAEIFDFAHHGEVFYAVSEDRMTLYLTENAGANWRSAELPLPDSATPTLLALEATSHIRYAALLYSRCNPPSIGIETTRSPSTSAENFMPSGTFCPIP